jgi:hypothetical protein
MTFRVWPPLPLVTLGWGLFAKVVFVKKRPAAIIRFFCTFAVLILKSIIKEQRNYFVPKKSIFYGGTLTPDEHYG